MTAKKIKYITKIVYKGQEFDIDLNTKPPFDILEIKKIGDKPLYQYTADGKREPVRYIPSSIIRQIFRNLGFKKIVKEVKSIPVQDGNLFHIHVTVITPEGEELDGYSADYLNINKITKASLGGLKSIEARAIKDALRYKFPFFDVDGEFLTEEVFEKMDTNIIEEEIVNKEEEDIKIKEEKPSLDDAIKMLEKDYQYKLKETVKKKILSSKNKDEALNNIKNITGQLKGYLKEDKYKDKKSQIEKAIGILEILEQLIKDNNVNI